MQNKPLIIKGARENNLKDIDLEIPHDKLVVITGISGSGKSSLAFETVYAEGQRRYIETFSPYTRQFLDKVKHPRVDSVENVRPAIAIQQRTRIISSRSTVGSITNLNDYLKVIWGNLSVAECPKCHSPFEVWTPSRLSQHLVEITQHERSTFLIGSTLKIDPSNFRGELERLIALGYSRCFDKKSGNILQIEEILASNIDTKVSDTLVMILDRVKGGAPATPALLKRLKESIEQAFSLGAGETLLIEQSEPYKITRFSNKARCLKCDLSIASPRVALFSYNNPVGACTACKGFGKVLEIDLAKVVPNPLLTLKDNALACWSGDGSKSERRALINFCTESGIPTDRPWNQLSPKDQELVLNHKSRKFRGVLPWFKALERKLYKMHVRVFLAKYRTQVDCQACKGTRFNSDALAYKVAGKTIAEINSTPIGEVLNWLCNECEKLGGEALPREIREIISATKTRLHYLVDLGLPYLTLDRQSRTLSGGETQRVNLATALGSELISTHFVLDEPSVGLHARDTERLIKAIKALQKRGNSLLVVEHDPDCIKSADHIIEIGPSAGKNGGQIIFNDSSESWPSTNSNNEQLDRQKIVGKITPVLKIRNANVRNLKNLDIDIPIGYFVGLSGVSGSGKSTLVREVIGEAYNSFKIGLKNDKKLNSVIGFENFDQVLFVDQSPLAKSPRANIATYSGLWDYFRDQLAKTDSAQSRALSKSAFSFNVSGGRCPACEGAGSIREDMQFLSDIYIQCEVCLGRRFQDSVLEVTLKEKNAHDLLQMSIEEIEQLFGDVPTVSSICLTLKSLGLGHLTLGHSLSDLSGGEAQRLKLVPFVEKSNSGKALLIFDEPTTGLHTSDVVNLVSLFQDLRDRGHSILCIEHNLLLLSACDWLIDLGPEGGAGGGYLLCAAEPKNLLADTSVNSETIRCLKEYLGSSGLPKRREKKKQEASENECTDSLIIRGAREHNLKDVSLDIPLRKFVSITGVSGSGKSTLAKDIIYAEGQRRYLDCLSPYARQYIQELKKPDVDQIKNIQPAICVYQHTFQPSRYSTVGTMCEANNYLRLLYSKVGVQYCPDHPNARISPLMPEEITRELLRSGATNIRILAPVIKNKKGSHREVLERAVSSEVDQVRIDGVYLSPRSVSFSGGLDKKRAHSIDFVVAKFNPANVPPDLAQSAVQLALSLGGGNIIVISDKNEIVYSIERTCPECKRGFFKPDPEDLSFHSKRGRCEECDGSGRTVKGAVCPECHGERLAPIGRNLRIGDKNICKLSNLTPAEIIEFLRNFRFSERDSAITEPILDELFNRLSVLENVGINYIPLSRECASLSGGELQRLRIATAIGSPLSGAIYIFDEPSAGLHPSDNKLIIDQLRTLCDRGNSILMIEHDIESIQSSEHVIEVGPGGGRDGGRIVYNGPSDRLREAGTATSSAIVSKVAVRPEESSLENPALHIQSTGANNIRSVEISIPLQKVVTVCGVSGAGKSTLVRGILCNLLSEESADNKSWSDGISKGRSDLEIARVIEIDQKPIGANSRSTPASYLGIFDDIRAVFANSLEAKSRGWAAGYFSYNSGKGRCATCMGLGEIKLEMNFLPDASNPCEACGGSRYSEDALSVMYNNMTISDVLKLTFEEARSRFAHHRKILQPLRQACDLGLGYLTLGQSSATLSGGESQRLKLISELSAKRRDHSLYILDEPTTGLHRQDVGKLLNTLREITSLGHSVILIEHDIDAVAGSDHIIEMGPGAGAAGGTIIFQGSPLALLQNKKLKTPWAEILSNQKIEVFSAPHMVDVVSPQGLSEAQ